MKSRTGYRECGSCQLCCEVMAVSEIGKPTHTRCPSQCSTGCVHYEERPESCKKFNCVWRCLEVADYLGLQDKESPTQTGLVLVTGEDSEFGPYIAAHQRDESSWLGYWAQKVIRRLESKTLVVVVDFQERYKITGPALRVRLAREVLSKHGIKTY